MSNEHDAAVLNAIFNPLLPSNGTPEETLQLKDVEEADDETFMPIKVLEQEGIRAAYLNNFDEAISIFTKAIGAAPKRASAYNNRAQVYRLKGEIKAATVDLNKAIELSAGKGRSASQAFCQRGLIYWKEGNTELAKTDFQAAAELGSQFAKVQLVKLNPYAALCNQMLQSVFNNLYA